jgi:hypothetical protein
VCTDCQQELASKLHRAAGLWEHVQDTVGYLVAVENGTRPSRAARRDVVGPICEGRRCDHETCVAIWKTETRTRHTEPPGVREEKGLLDLDAFENSWIVRNTVDAWTSHVEQHRGNRPAPKPKRAIVGAQTLTVIHDDARPDLCTLSDLPFEQCAAHPGRPHQAAS